jgi:hypothetical protein
VQDDTQVLGLISEDGTVRALVLPPGPGDRRRFDDELRNRHLKLDLEALTTIEYEGRPMLLGFGSGSTPARENILVVRELLPGVAPLVQVVPARPFYALLRSTRAFSGGDLNVEGAATASGELVLLQRGVHGGDATGSALMRLPLDVFLQWLEHRGPLPKPLSVRRYDLGQLGKGAPYGFSGINELDGGRFVFTASAEATWSPVMDGPVLGSKLGVLTADTAWAADLVDAAGELLPIKAEGVLPKRNDPKGFWIVIDGDDVDAPGRLCEVMLRDQSQPMR